MSKQGTQRKISECVSGCGGVSPAITTPGILTDIKILGLESRNKRRYTAKCVREALSLYEGVAIYFDHSPHEPVRTFLSKFGVLRNVRYVEGDGLRGDLHYNNGHLYAPTFEGWARSDPNEIGLSHMAFVKSRMDDQGIEIVEVITSVESVDIVSRPATTKGLYESLQPMNEEMPPAVEAEPEAPVEAEPELDHMDHLAAMVAAIFKDKTMNTAEKVKRVKKALACLDDGEEQAPVEDTPSEPVKEEEPVEEDEKKAEEAFAGIKNKIEKMVTEAISSIKRAVGVKEPVSTPAKVSGEKLTLESFLSEMKGK